MRTYCVSSGRRSAGKLALISIYVGHHLSRYTRLPRLSTFCSEKVIFYGELNGHMAYGMESQAKPHHPFIYMVSHCPAPLTLMTSQEHKPIHG